MTFLEHIDLILADMNRDIKACQEVIADLQIARDTYLGYLECEALEPAEKPKEPLPVQEAPKTLPAPVEAAPELPQEQETGRITGDRRRKEFWTPERKAEASRLAKERWATRQKRLPVEERPRADFKKAVIPALKPVTREIATVEVKPDVFKMIPEAVRNGLGIVEKGSSAPKPSWSDPTPERSDIVHVDDCPLSIAGMVLINKGKFAAHLDKKSREILQVFISNFGATVERGKISHAAPNIDQAVENMKSLIGAGVDIVETETGWKMVAVEEEEA